MSEYKKYFYEVTKYLEDNFGINVVLSYDTDGDFWFPALKKILINKNNQWRERYFSLIHESGHARLDMESLSIKSLKMQKEHQELIKTKKDFVSVINEEILAWSLGKNLSYTLMHDIDLDVYNKIKTNCIMSYIKFGLKEVYKNKINIDIIRTI